MHLAKSYDYIIGRELILIHFCSKMCIRADPRGCLGDICVYPEHVSQSSGQVTPDDGHPTKPIGHRKTCWCYKKDRCIETADEREGLPCTKMNEQEVCGKGYCSPGGGFIQAHGGTAPVFYGDCQCRNASTTEWSKLKNVYVNGSEAINTTENTERLALAKVTKGIAFKWTFWDSNPCGYNGSTQWSGSDCRLVRPPFQKYMFGWGDTRAGQLSRQLENLKSPDDQPQNLFRPTQIRSLDMIDLMGVAAGDFHAAAIAAPQPHDLTVCNLSHVDPESKGAPIEQGGFGRDFSLGEAFRCDGNILYTWGGNTEGELGHGYITPSQAVDCTGIGNIRVPCENMGGSLQAMRLRKLIGRNVTQVSLGYKHTNVVLGDCPETSKDRCGICFGHNVDCVGCSGITNLFLKKDW